MERSLRLVGSPVFELPGPSLVPEASLVVPATGREVVTFPLMGGIWSTFGLFQLLVNYLCSLTCSFIPKSRKDAKFSTYEPPLLEFNGSKVGILHALTLILMPTMVI